MSTTVDNRVQTRTRRPAAQTRVHVSAVARRLFSQIGFDALGIREIAAAAAVDPATVIRLFGSKSELFKAVVEDAFTNEPLLDGPIEGLPTRLATHLSSPAEDGQTDEGDDLMLLLRSAASVTAGPILSDALNLHLVAPLAARIGGENAALRAALLTSQILGYATLCFAIRSPALLGATQEETKARLTLLFEVALR